MTAFLRAAVGLISQLTGLSAAQVEADIAAHVSSGGGPAPSNWQLVGATEPTRVQLDRVAPVSREETPCVVVAVDAVTFAGAGQDSTLNHRGSGATRADIELVMRLYARGEPPLVVSDALLELVQARIYIDVSLGGVVRGLRPARFDWQPEGADLANAALECIWTAATVVRNQTLDIAA